MDLSYTIVYLNKNNDIISFSRTNTDIIYDKKESRVFVFKDVEKEILENIDDYTVEKNDNEEPQLIKRKQ